MDYNFLANSTGNIFAKIMYGAITGAAFGAGGMLFLLLWFALYIAGIFLGFIVFGKKNKFLCILYGMISSVIALVTFITIINVIPPSKQMITPQGSGYLPKTNKQPQSICGCHL